MRTFAFVFAIAILIVACHTEADARVIAGNLDNAVAVYFFTSLNNSGNVPDYSNNQLDGELFDGASLSRISRRNCLSLPRNASYFHAWDDSTSLSVSKEFSIVAWVKIPSQQHDFLINVGTYDPVDEATDEFKGGVTLTVKSSGNLRGTYDYGSNSVWIQTTGRSVNNNTWHHIGFVINQTQMRLYLDGVQVYSDTFSAHQSFNGVGTYTLANALEEARGSVDNIGFFKNDFSDAQVKHIYDKGLASIISIAPVEPGGKVATTWGALKHK